MSRFVRALAVAALLLAVLAPASVAHQGNPNYRSVLRGVTPAQPGLKLVVVNYDDSFELTNRTGRTVVVQGYENEPYARVLPDGTVQVNRRSPASYLNDQRTGDAPVPASASAKAAPQWQTVDRTGRFIWHDHRMHWMGTARPAAVKDPGKKTKIFDYAIPLRVGDQKPTINGTLYWVGEPGGGPPTAAIALLALLLLGGIALVIVVRRRRAEPPAPKAEPGADGAW